MKYSRTLVGLSTLMLLSSSCDFNSLDDQNSQFDANAPFFLRGSTASFATLSESESCESLNSKINMQFLDEIRESLERQRYYLQGSLARGSGQSGFPQSEAADNASNENGPDDVSSTNTQVAGVDEADMVKTNGTHIFSFTEQGIAITASWPAEELKLISKIDLRGKPLGMFLNDGQLTVAYNPLNPIDSSQSYNSRAFLADVAEPYYYPYKSNLVVLAQYDVSDTSAPLLSSSQEFGGYYQDMRRIDQTVHLIQQAYKSWPAGLQTYVNTYENDGYISLSEFDRRAADILAQAGMKISELTFADQYPDLFAKDDVIHTNDCQNFYIPEKGDRYGVTKITSLDLSTALVKQGGYLGYTDIVYANEDSLILSSNASRWWEESNFWESRTFLHRFKLDGELTYGGTANVNGWVNDQFSLSAQNDILRVAVTQDVKIKEEISPNERWWSNRTTVNRVVTLQMTENSLLPLGETIPLAAGERIFSARFQGNSAFIVTFRQVDPLFTIDLSEPAYPKVVGELKIPGFSTYIHMLDEVTLLTVGQDADLEGRVTGLKISMFDVSDFSKPREMYNHVIPNHSDSTWSEALYDHKAFTYFAARGLLAIPIGGYSSQTSVSRLQLFDISKEAGISERGAISALETDFDGRWWDWWNANQIRRSVFADDYVYAIQKNGVIASHIDSPENAIATVQFSQ